MTAWSLLGMLSTKFEHTWGGISFHSFWIQSQSSCILVGDVGYLASWCLRCDYRCSIGFRSGDWAGHTISWILLSWNHSVASLETYFGSLSCWKRKSLQQRPAKRAEDQSQRSRMPTYCFASIRPSVKWSSPTPLALMDPQTISLPPPPLTILTMCWGWSGPPCFHHPQTRPSNCIWLILVSSDQRTWFQSSGVQPRCCLVKANQRCQWIFLRTSGNWKTSLDGNTLIMLSTR